MRRTTTLTALGSLLALPLGLGLASAPAHAVETCDGRPATIVVPAKPGSFRTDPVVGTPGDDVIIPTSVSDDDARVKYPQGFQTHKPYLRTVAQPK